MSWYFTVRFDPSYSRFAATAPLIDFLGAMPELRQTGPMAFEAISGFPGVTVILAECSPAGNYSSDGLFLPRVNIVELVCSNAGDTSWYEAFANRIATFLNWEAVELLEDRLIAPPAARNGN
jgi:hypothetical protein